MASLAMDSLSLKLCRSKLLNNKIAVSDHTVALIETVLPIRPTLILLT